MRTDEPNYWNSRINRPWRRRRLLGVAGALGAGAAGLALVGCGDDDSSVGSSTPSSANTNPAGSTAKPKAGGTLTFADRNDAIWSSAPYGVASYGSPLFYAFNDTLFRYPSSDLKPEPRLAESYEFNADQTELVVKLRPKIQYQDGTPIVAQHVADNIAALSAKGTANSQVKGPVNAYIQSTQAVNETTVKFILKRPGNLVFDALNFLAILDTRTLADVQSGKPWNGSGPFQMTDYRPQQGATWKAHRGFWKPVTLDSVEFMTFADASALAIAVETGKVQLTNRLNPDDTQRFSSDKKYQHIVGSGLTRAYSWGLSAKGAVTADARIRRAVYHAIDRKRIAEDVTLGINEPRNSLWPPSSKAFEDRFKEDPFNLDTVRKLVTEAGYANGTPPIQLMTTSDNFEGKRMFEIVQADARKAGLNLEIQQVDGAAFSEAFQGNTFPGGYQTTFGFFGMYPDTLPVMNFQVRVPNSAGYAAPAYADLQKRMNAARTDEERKKLYAEFNTLWAEDVWVMLITDIKDQWILSKDVAGFKIDDYDVPNWEDAGRA